MLDVHEIVEQLLFLAPEDAVGTLAVAGLVAHDVVVGHSLEAVREELLYEVLVHER